MTTGSTTMASSCDNCKDWGNTVPEEHAILYGCVRCPKCDRATYPNEGVNLPAGCVWAYNSIQAITIMRAIEAKRRQMGVVEPAMLAYGVARESDWPRDLPSTSSQESTPMGKKKYSIAGLAAHNMVRSSYAVMGKGKTLNRKARKSIMKNVKRNQEVAREREAAARKEGTDVWHHQVGGGEAPTG